MRSIAGMCGGGRDLVDGAAVPGGLAGRHRDRTAPRFAADEAVRPGLPGNVLPRLLDGALGGLDHGRDGECLDHDSAVLLGDDGGRTVLPVECPALGFRAESCDLVIGAVQPAAVALAGPAVLLPLRGAPLTVIRQYIENQQRPT
jgi:hypothetical protein